LPQCLHDKVRDHAPVLSFAKPEARERVAGLTPVFEGLKSELLLHLRKVEMVLFPAIESYEAAAKARQPRPPLLYHQSPSKKPPESRV
jgi:iron-sulfur cluster repair protein YtfE (RIC family)